LLVSSGYGIQGFKVLFGATVLTYQVIFGTVLVYLVTLENS